MSGQIELYDPFMVGPLAARREVEMVHMNRHASWRSSGGYNSLQRREMFGRKVW